MRMPLEDVTVLDLSHALAGPFCSTMLADFGAEVIKLEPKGAGDIARAWGPPLPGGEQHGLPLLVAPGQEHVLERRDEGGAVLRAIGVGAVAGIFAEFGAADHRAEHLPELLAAHGQREIACLRAEGLIGEERLVRGAQRGRD